MKKNTSFALLEQRVTNTTRYARIYNYQRQIESGLLDMTEAIEIMYAEGLGHQPSVLEAVDAINLFDSGKSRLLRHLRWTSQLNPGCCASKWVDLISPLDIYSYKSVDEWADFIESLPLY